MSDSNKALVRRYFEEVFNDRHLEHVEEIVATDYVEHAVAPFAQSEPGGVSGPEHLRQTVAWLVAQFPDIRMELEAEVEEGDLVVARVLSHGTNTGLLNGVIPPTGKRFRARQSHWFRIAGGRIVEHWATRDDLPLMIQLGVVAPGAPPR
jgi:predicted ester cyclase